MESAREEHQKSSDLGPGIEIPAKRAVDLSDEEVAERHRLWMAEHGKEYKDEEEKERRMKIFKETLLFIDEHNRGGHSYTVGLNQFADMTNEEFKSNFCGGFRVPKDRRVEGDGDL